MGAIHNLVGASVAMTSRPVPWVKLEKSTLSARLAQAFSELAPRQLTELVQAVSARQVLDAKLYSEALSESLSAVGARWLARWVDATHADIAAADWVVVDARVATLQSYFSTVLDSVASRADGAAQGTTEGTRAD